MDAGVAATARRRFKTAAVSTTQYNTMLIAAAALMLGMMLIATLLLKTSGTGWFGVVGSATQHLASLTSQAASGGSGDDRGEGEDPALPCRESGYCSVGKLQAYVGEVDSLEGFKAALKACSYKKDFFLITIGSSGHVLGMNFVVGAWKLGLANVMLHSTGNESCAKLADAGYNNVTCVWSDRDWFPIRAKCGRLAESRDIWAVRYILMARAVWLGYNVWLLDSDSYLYRDPYKYVKVPPYKDVIWIALADSDNPRPTFTNGGASYIQNAAPGGGAAWTIAYMAERMIRVNEDWELWAANANYSGMGHLQDAMMDQPVLADAIATNRVRHPYIRFTWSESPWIAKDLDAQLQYNTPGVQLQFPPEWVNLTGSLEVATVPGFNLTIPHINGTWREEIGGKPHPPRGNYSLAFIKMLEEESGAKYDQIEGPSPKDFVPPPNETFIFAPQWLVGTWLGRRMGGWWDLQPPAQVVVHLMYMPGVLAAQYQKEYGLKSINAFNFDVAQALQGRMFASASSEQQPLPRVLALAPGLQVSSTSRDDFKCGK